MRLNEGPDSGRSSRLVELRSVGVDGSTDDPGDATVCYAVNTPRRQNKLRNVNSRGAWENRLRSRGPGASVCHGERRRRHASSSSSGDGSGGEQLPLATPLPDEGSVLGAPHHPPRQGHRPMEGSMEVTGGQGLQSGTSADRALGSAYAGQGSFAALPGHASVGAYAGQGSSAAPLVRQELMSEESDDGEESGELSGEVRSILNSRTGVRQGIRSADSRAGMVTHQRYDNP